MGVEYHTKDNKLSIEDEKPSEEDTEHAADIFYAPEPSSHASILIAKGGLHLSFKLIVEIKLD